MTPLQTGVGLIGIACVSFSAIVCAFATLAWFARKVEQRHRRRHAARRIERAASFPFERGAP